MIMRESAKLLLMVQKSQGQPPGMYKNPVNNGISTTYQLSTSERPDFWTINQGLP